MRTIKIMVTGGGSSGHVSPALAAIRAINELSEQSGGEWQPRFQYIGSKHGIEKRQIEEAGIPFASVATGKMRRYFSLENAIDTLRVPLGVIQALGQVLRFRPDVLLSTGGFVCVPPVIAAWLLRVPIITHEQTVQVGLANRIAARFARRIALSFPAALQELRPAQRARAFVTGNPVRPVIFGGDKQKAFQIAKFAPQDDELPMLYVTGGSQGARIINRAIEAALPELLKHCRIYHQCGEQPAGEEQDYDRLSAAALKLPPELQTRYYVTRFVGSEIGHVFAASDLLLSRAGAGTITEVCALGKAAVYVPLVPTGGDEQTRNARMCVDAGAAAIIPQSELSAERLLQDLPPLLGDRARLEAMGKAATSLARPQAAQDLARAVMELAGAQSAAS
jgi:UDP-N-acetylglucosamine--N-acetylmuramyl-(pentapeptide) pyrophosphoryl-undecaprenol N-acetylglucosamine transferase